MSKIRVKNCGPIQNGFGGNIGFRVIVYAVDVESTDKTVGETVGETVKGNTAIILSYIKDNPHITRDELAVKIQLSVRGIDYQLAKLRQAKLIERVGSTKSGYWKILE